MPEGEPGGPQLPDFESCENISDLAVALDSLCDMPDLLDQGVIDSALTRLAHVIKADEVAIIEARDLPGFDEDGNRSVFQITDNLLDAIGQAFVFLRSDRPDLESELDAALDACKMWKKEIRGESNDNSGQ